MVLVQVNVVRHSLDYLYTLQDYFKTNNLHEVEVMLKSVIIKSIDIYIFLK